MVSLFHPGDDDERDYCRGNQVEGWREVTTCSGDEERGYERGCSPKESHGQIVTNTQGTVAYVRWEHLNESGRSGSGKQRDDDPEQDLAQDDQREAWVEIIKKSGY